MNKCHENINWHNDTTPAINETNLNYMDGCIDTVDDRIVSFDTTKANQSDLLQSVKNVTYNTTTGVITVIWWNGNTFTIDLNIEKIPVSFSMSETGVITMTTADGTEYTADISTVLKLYTFVDSDEIDFTVVQNGNNYTVTASIVEGSITADKLQPNFLADCQAAANTASGAATASNANKLASEGWAQGTQNSIPVGPDSPYYEKSAKYYAEFTGGVSLEALNDVAISNKQPDDSLVWDEDLGKWVNKDVSTKFATLPVTNLNAVAGDSQVTLSWTNPEDVTLGGTTVAELELIKVYRDGALVERALLSTYTDTGLVNGQTYVYTVVAETTKSVESAVATISATPIATGVMLTISNCGANASVTVTDGTETVTAQADASGNASVLVSGNATYTVTANGTGENKRYATDVVVGESAVSVKMLNVPKQFKEVKDIVANGTEWLDTLFAPNNNTTFEADIELSEDSAMAVGAVRNSASENTKMLGLSYIIYDEKIQARYTYNSDIFNTSGYQRKRETLKLDKNVCYQDSVLVHTFTSATFQSAYTLPLFAYRKGNTTYDSNFKGKLYSAKIWDNGTLARRFIPTVLTFSGEAGLYDTVNDVFYTNKGTGAFGYDFLQDDPDPVIRVPKYVMTVNIDESESDPEASCTYSDDAVFMDAGSSGWDNLFGYKPCLFVNGAVSKYLNPNNFAQDASGNAVDITTLGNDVMIEFPKHGYKISKSGDIISVSLTNKPQAEGEAEGFCYKPFSRNAIGDRDYFYYGAYKSYSSGNKLYSSSGKTPTASKTRATYRSEATARGTGYFQNGFYQLTYLQVLYLLKYKNRNSQAALGYGYVGGSSAQATGATNARGLNYGNKSSRTDRVKLFGIEDMWGNISQWMDGLSTDGSWKYVVTHLPVNFDDATSGTAHTTYDSGITADLGGYISRVQGTTDCGFAAKVTSGSETTYWADSGYVKTSCVTSFGASWDSGATTGIFKLNVSDATSSFDAYFASRLMYV